jgi:molybdate transport system ATP-binding protein
MDLGRSEGERPEGVRATEELFASPNTFASAILSGCKNYSRAEKADEHSVYAVDWGVTLVCGAVPDDVAYAGVRAHHVVLRPEGIAGGEGGGGRNVFSCRVLRVIQDVFSTIVNVQPLNALGGSGEFSRFSCFSYIRAELPKQEGTFRKGDVVSAEIGPESVMLLK